MRATLRSHGYVEIYEVQCNGCPKDVLVTNEDIKTLMDEQPNAASAIILCLPCARSKFPQRAQLMEIV
jgi:hypothetical protein